MAATMAELMEGCSFAETGDRPQLMPQFAGSQTGLPSLTLLLGDAYATQEALAELSDREFEVLRQIMEEEASRRLRENSDPALFQESLKAIREILIRYVNENERNTWTFSLKSHERGSIACELNFHIQACLKYATGDAYDEAKEISDLLEGVHKEITGNVPKGPWKLFKAELGGPRPPATFNKPFHDAISKLEDFVSRYTAR